MRLLHGYLNSVCLVLLLWLVVHIASSYLVGFDAEPWSDEAHFLTTVYDFAESITTEKLLTYDQMPTPLSFVVYGLWGRALGTSLPILRLLSLVFGLAVVVLFHRWLFRRQDNGVAAFWLTSLVLLHPYVIGLSQFVYCDLMALLPALAALWATGQKRPAIAAVCLALALLTRQYMATFWLAIFCYHLLGMFVGQRREYGGLIATALAAVPVLAVFIFWGGTSPDNQYRDLYLNQGWAYHGTGLTLYVSLTSLYLLPLLVAFRRRWWSTEIAVAALAPAVVWYLLFPVQASPHSETIGVATVGLLHRGLVWLLPWPWVVDAVFVIGLWLGLVVLWQLGRWTWAKTQTNGQDPDLLPCLAAFSFLIIMPLSYLWWEKYFVPQLFVLILCLASLGRGPNSRLSAKPLVDAES